jgi:hypothetical protein
LYGSILRVGQRALVKVLFGFIVGVLVLFCLRYSGIARGRRPSFPRHVVMVYRKLIEEGFGPVQEYGRFTRVKL